jgi:hypothetical protein
MAVVQVKINGDAVPFTLQFTEVGGRWTAPRQLPESYFPLVGEFEGQRVEFYSDGTFAKVAD